MPDLVNPFRRFEMTQGWTAGSHKNNPAMDYATPVGFQFTAPAAGVYRHQAMNLSRTDPTAPGIMGELLLVGGNWHGYRIRFAHLDHHIADHGERVGQSDIVAATGNTGYVRPAPTRQYPHAGAHVHTYGLTPAGLRWNWTLYAGAPDVADGGSTPFDPQGDDMPLNADTDYEAFKTMMWRFLKFDSRDGGAEASGVHGPTVFERLTTAAARPTAAQVSDAVWAAQLPAQDAAGNPVTRDGKPVTYLARGYVASINAQVAALQATVKALAVGQGADPKAIEAAAERGARAALAGLTLKAE